MKLKNLNYEKKLCVLNIDFLGQDYITNWCVGRASMSPMELKFVGYDSGKMNHMIDVS